MAILSGTDPAVVAGAAATLAAGGLVAFPTETVYGLGARADDDEAVARVYAAKGRPAGHPLIVHVADADAAHRFASAMTPAAQRLIDAFWPGPLTVIVPRRPGIADAAAGGQDCIGLRMPAHPVALALLRAAARLGVAGVAAPSANRYGRISPTTAAHVQQDFGTALLVLDGGACDVGIESAIVDCSRPTPALLRPGQLGRGRLEAVLGRPLAQPDAASPRAPGTVASHYAPVAPLTLLEAGALRRRLLAAALPQAATAEVVGVYSPAVFEGPVPVADAGTAGPAASQDGAPAAPVRVIHRSMPANAAAVAHELFAVLRDFDAQGVSAIWVQRPPPDPAWDGVRDRLQRAAT